MKKRNILLTKKQYRIFMSTKRTFSVNSSILSYDLQHLTFLKHKIFFEKKGYYYSAFLIDVCEHPRCIVFRQGVAKDFIGKDFRNEDNFLDKFEEIANKLSQKKR